MNILSVLILVAMIYPLIISSQLSRLLPYAVCFTIDIPCLHEHCLVPVGILYLGCVNPSEVSVF